MTVQVHLKDRAALSARVAQNPHCEAKRKALVGESGMQSPVPAPAKTEHSCHLRTRFLQSRSSHSSGCWTPYSLPELTLVLTGGYSLPQDLPSEAPTAPLPDASASPLSPHRRAKSLDRRSTESSLTVSPGARAPRPGDTAPAACIT